MSGINAHVVLAKLPVRDMPSTKASQGQLGRLTWQQTQMLVMPATHALLQYCSAAGGGSRGTVWLAADISCPRLAYMRDHIVKSFY